jgi:hypothetical protein
MDAQLNLDTGIVKYLVCGQEFVTHPSGPRTVFDAPHEMYVSERELLPEERGSISEIVE